MAVNVYTDDVEVVNGSSLDTPATDNYSLYGNEAGKSVKIPKETLTTRMKNEFISDGSCLANQAISITVDSGVATIDINKILNNDMAVASDSIDSIVINGREIRRFFFFFTSLGNDITIQGTNVYYSKTSFKPNESYLAEITTNNVNGIYTIFIIFHELKQL